MAIPTLTAAGTAAGFSLSQFADAFPTVSCCGLLGIAFVRGGKVMVSDYPGNVRIFATDTDGQHASAAPVAANYGSTNAVGLARSGSVVYVTQQSAGNVARLNLDGTFNSAVVGGIPTASGIAANNLTGKLYVSDGCSSSGIWTIDSLLNTKSLFKAGSYDGLNISSDGTTTVRLKVEQIQLVSGVKRFDLGCIGLQGA